MRGDSVRDFYAKTLALLGLGMLAGTGALVDNWPTSAEPLLMNGPARNIAMAGPLLSGSLGPAAGDPAFGATGARVAELGVTRTIGTRTIVAPTIGTPTIGTPAIVASDRARAGRARPSGTSGLADAENQSPRMTAGVAGEHRLPITSAMFVSGTPSVSLGIPQTMSVAALTPLVMLASAARRDQSGAIPGEGVANDLVSGKLDRSRGDDDGLLTGAMKKTGASIVRGGAKTGTSIVEAFRVVGVAVRRALPN
jgi:hypothetical protein